MNNNSKSAKKAGKKSARQLEAAKATVRGRQQPMVQGDELSQPTKEYIAALSNPFDGPLASIPDFPSVPSRRLRTFIRGTFQTSSTNGFGFCVYSPYYMAMNNTASIHYSSSTYAGTVIDVNTATTGVNAATSNSDYVQADFALPNLGANSQGRIVSAGIRVRIISTELERGGQIVGVQTPNHTILDGLSFDQINGYDCSRRFSANRKWKTALYCPVYQNELLYTSGFGTSVGGFLPYPILGFVVQAPSNTSISYEYEAFAVLEVNGRDVRGLQPSAADPAGFAAVQTTAQMAMMRPHESTNHQHVTALMKGVHSVAHNTLTGFASKAIDSGVKWVEHNGLSVLAGLTPLLAL